MGAGQFGILANCPRLNTVHSGLCALADGCSVRASMVFGCEKPGGYFAITQGVQHMHPGGSVKLSTESQHCPCFLACRGRSLQSRAPRCPRGMVVGERTQMELKREHVEWLSIVRYQSDLAENQAKEPEPLNAVSISTIHDAVESMLSLIAEAHQVATKSKDFAKLFDTVSDQMKTQGGDLSGHRSAMIALNSARVGFKHHGNQSNKQTIDRHIANGLNFLADAAEQGLNTPFAEVSLLDFVRDPKVREYIRRADDCSSDAAEDRMLAFQYLRLGFETLVQGYQQSKSYYPGRPLITTKPSFLPSVFGIRAHVGEVGEKAFEWLENLDSWVRILVLGIDVQEYTFFLAYTPGVLMTLGGQAVFRWHPGSDLSDDVFRRCRQFVVESAIRLGRRDFAYGARNASQSLLEDQRNTGISRVMAPDENGLLTPHEDYGDVTSEEETSQ